MISYKKKINNSPFFSNLRLWLVLFTFFSALAVGGFLISSYKDKISYDSSSDGSEVAELQEQTIPPDVQEKIDQEKRALAQKPSNVLGSQSPVAVRVPILIYHYIEYIQDKNDKTRMALNTTPYTLEEEVKTLANAGYTFMTNNELVAVLRGKAKLPKKPILLTFDDSYRDFYIDAYPILKKYHAKATQFVISGFLGYKNHLDINQLQEIARDGLVEIGDHTVHHVGLKGMPLQKVTDEILESKVAIEQIIHKPVVSFAYPFGAFDQPTLEVVKNSGFFSAMSTIPGVQQKQENNYFLSRLRPGGRTGQVLLTWLDNQK